MRGDVLNAVLPSWRIGCLVLCLAVLSASADADRVSWRYYRPGNTGIQGDYNESIFIDADGDPWIAGYNPIAEEGGIAKFIQAQNRWFNVSNVDFATIGSANEVGCTRVSDMVADGQGNLWLGTWRGALRMNLAVGPSSLVRFGPGNSSLPGGLTRDVALAPDGSIWFSAESTYWGGGGLTRYNPATNTWSHIDGHGGGKIAAQPKPGGGFYIWADVQGYDGMERLDTTTNTWTTYTFGEGRPADLVGLDSADEAGNLWMTKWIGNQGETTIDCMRPDGTWANPPLPPIHPQVTVAAMRAFGNMQALFVDGYMELHRFNGTSWTNLGPIPHSGFIDDLDIDSAGNIWLCGTGTGGAVRRDVVTGFWQRYRVTNTSQFDFFNNDLAINPFSDIVYACANASSGVGGMVKFDGVRWTGFVTDLDYGLGGPWPFAGSPQSEAVYIRSNGRVVVNPINNYTHEFDGVNWTQIPGGPDQVRQYLEDSLGRLWGVGHYSGFGIYENGGYSLIGDASLLRRDPSRSGTVWANAGYEIVRTDGSYRFARGIEYFPDLSALGASFQGLAVEPNGTAWVGTYAPNTTAANALIRTDPTTGISHVVFKYGVNWPFPGEYVEPVAYTPDGRLWMKYGKEYPFDDMGLLWWDGTNVGVFPAPPNGEWQFGGLPHYIISDLEVKTIPGGYELWMCCFSRGIAVLTVLQPAVVPPDGYSLFRGVWISGGLPELIDSDDARLVIRNEVTISRQDSPITVRADAVAPFASVTSLRFKLEAQVTAPGLQQSVDLFDYSTNEWVNVDVRSPSVNTDGVATITVNNPNRFIQPSTKKMRAQIRYRQIDVTGSRLWQAKIDQVQWQLEP